MAERKKLRKVFDDYFAEMPEAGQIRVVSAGNGKAAVVNSEARIITNGQTALEFAFAIGQAYGCSSIAVKKEMIAEDFFKLSTGVAGEIAQKLVNYHIRLAVIGDFSGYTSKPLHDYIYESNKGKHLYFVDSEQAAIEKLGGA
jgi:hypothetical protein